MPRYLFIFDITKKLGTRLNNASCSRLVNMLCPYIKTVKEEMKRSEFQQDIGRTSAYMNIIMNSNKWFGLLSSKNTFSTDRLFK